MHGCPCLSSEVHIVSVLVQLGSPKNIIKTFEIVRISQSISQTPQLAIYFNAIPEMHGCPCLSSEIRSVSVSTQLASPENIGLGIVVTAL